MHEKPKVTTPTAQDTPLRPTWRSVAAAVFGLLTLIGIFALILLDIRHGLTPAFVAFGAALSGGFFGDEIAVQGKIGWPWARKKPMHFAAAGGAATFIVFYMIMQVFLVDLPEQTFAMTIQENDTFESIVALAASQIGVTAKFSPNCTTFRSSPLAGGSPSASGIEGWIEDLAFRLPYSESPVSVHARLLHRQALLEVSCEQK